MLELFEQELLPIDPDDAAQAAPGPPTVAGIVGMFSELATYMGDPSRQWEFARKLYNESSGPAAGEADVLTQTHFAEIEANLMSNGSIDNLAELLFPAAELVQTLMAQDQSRARGHPAMLAVRKHGPDCDIRSPIKPDLTSMITKWQTGATTGFGQRSGLTKPCLGGQRVGRRRSNSCARLIDRPNRPLDIEKLLAEAPQFTASRGILGSR